MKIEEIYKLFKKNYLVDTDTRKIRKNTIYFALKGENFNGNVFAKEAISKGALFSVVDEKKYATQENIILVENVLKTLQDLANFHRRKINVPIIGLTEKQKQNLRGPVTMMNLINEVTDIASHDLFDVESGMRERMRVQAGRMLTKELDTEALMFQVF